MHGDVQLSKTRLVTSTRLRVDPALGAEQTWVGTTRLGPLHASDHGAERRRGVMVVDLRLTVALREVVGGARHR